MSRTRQNAGPANSAAIPLPAVVLSREIPLPRNLARSHQEVDLQHFFNCEKMVFLGSTELFPCRQGKKTGEGVPWPDLGRAPRRSVRQIEKLAPTVWADIAGHDLARSRRAKQGAGGAGEATLRPVLIVGFGLRHLLLRHRPRDAEDHRCAGLNPSGKDCGVTAWERRLTTVALDS